MQSDAIDQNAARSPTIAASCETKAAPIRHNAAFFRKWSTLFENNEGQSETSDESLEMASTALARRYSSASFWIEAGEPALFALRVELLRLVQRVPALAVVAELALGGSRLAGGKGAART